MRNPQVINKNQDKIPLSHIPKIDSAGTIESLIDEISLVTSKQQRFAMDSNQEKMLLAELPYPVTYNKTFKLKRSFNKWIVMVNLLTLLILCSFTILHNT